MKHKKTNWGVLVLAAIICACCLGGCAQQAEEISQVSQSVASVSSDVSESIDSTPSSSSNASKSVSSSLPSQESEPSSESASQTSYSSFEEELIPDLKGLTQEECEKYYSDAVFVGDSVMLGFSMFVRDSRKTNPDFLPGIQFHTSGSYGTGNALWDISDDSVHPLLRGQQTKTEDALSILKAKKAFLLFGLNDVGVYGVEGSIENYGTLCDRILEKILI